MGGEDDDDAILMLEEQRAAGKGIHTTTSVFPVRIKPELCHPIARKSLLMKPKSLGCRSSPLVIKNRQKIASRRSIDTTMSKIPRASIRDSQSKSGRPSNFTQQLIRGRGFTRPSTTITEPHVYSENRNVIRLELKKSSPSVTAVHTPDNARAVRSSPQVPLRSCDVPSTECVVSSSLGCLVERSYSFSSSVSSLTMLCSDESDTLVSSSTLSRFSSLSVPSTSPLTSPKKRFNRSSTKDKETSDWKPSCVPSLCSDRGNVMKCTVRNVQRLSSIEVKQLEKCNSRSRQGRDNSCRTHTLLEFPLRVERCSRVQKRCSLVTYAEECGTTLKCLRTRERVVDVSLPGCPNHRGQRELSRSVPTQHHCLLPEQHGGSKRLSFFFRRVLWCVVSTTCCFIIIVGVTLGLLEWFTSPFDQIMV